MAPSSTWFESNDVKMHSQDDAEDTNEFHQEEEMKPLEQLLKEKGKNEFVFDPENGGGRRRRIKKLSRIEFL